MSEDQAPPDETVRVAFPGAGTTPAAVFTVGAVNGVPKLQLSEQPLKLPCQFNTAECADARCRHSSVCLEARRIELEEMQFVPMPQMPPQDESI